MKNIYFKSLLIIAMLFALGKSSKCQDIHFSQFSEAPLLRNPALAGIFSGDFRVQAVYRNQWNSVTVPYQTTSLNAEYKLPVGNTQDFLTIGAEILYDKAGTVALTATNVLPVLNYHKSLSADRNMYLSAGFSAGVVQRKLDRSKITTNSQFDGDVYNSALSNGENFANNGYMYFDGNAGLSFNSQLGENEDNNIFFGVAYHHFNKSAKVSFYDGANVALVPKVVVSAGLKMSMTDYSYLTFHADYSSQGPSTEIIGGALYSLKLDDPEDPQHVISGGMFIRWNDAFIPVIKMDIRPLAFALSYDVNVSQLKTASQGRGGFELSLSYQKYLDRDNSSREAVRCPR
ncbi:MAG: PorP/SprF family type IX secretion system membrane protein, partial [Ginsengibacter sp.]